MLSLSLKFERMLIENFSKNHIFNELMFMVYEQFQLCLEM